MYIRVQVTPNAKKEQILKKSDTEFAILVKEPRERNLANKRVRELLAEAFGVTVAQVHMVAGHRSQTKMFDVEF